MNLKVLRITSTYTFLIVLVYDPWCIKCLNFDRMRSHDQEVLNLADWLES